MPEMQGEERSSSVEDLAEDILKQEKKTTPEPEGALPEFSSETDSFLQRAAEIGEEKDEGVEGISLGAKIGASLVLLMLIFGSLIILYGAYRSAKSGEVVGPPLPTKMKEKIPFQKHANQLDLQGISADQTSGQTTASDAEAVNVASSTENATAASTTETNS